MPICSVPLRIKQAAIVSLRRGPAIVSLRRGHKQAVTVPFLIYVNYV